MLMLESGAIVAAATKASVADVPVVDVGMIGGIDAATMVGEVVTVGAIIGAISGG